MVLIQSADCYVDSLSAEKMRIYRGTLTEMGQDSPYRTRTIQENLQLFLDMRMGIYPDGTHVSIGMVSGCCVMLLGLQYFKDICSVLLKPYTDEPCNKSIPQIEYVKLESSS